MIIYRQLVTPVEMGWETKKVMAIMSVENASPATSNLQKKLAPPFGFVTGADDVHVTPADPVIVMSYPPSQADGSNPSTGLKVRLPPTATVGVVGESLSVALYAVRVRFEVRALPAAEIVSVF
jgi:hypothetical protein